MTLRTLPCAGALLVVLTGCGGGSSGVGAEDAAAPPASIATPAPTPTPSPDPAPVAPTPAPTPADALPGWTLVWADEFDVPGLPDATKWEHDTERNRVGWYNNELQYYARNRLENARVEDGRLIITARRERLSTASDFGGQNFTSARLLTRGKASWTYGFMEVRAKLPCSLGTWPAIWMLGTRGAWPDDGEIDIMEQTGQNKGEVLGTIHTRAYNYFNGSLGPGQGARTMVADGCTKFHKYQLTWTADKIVIGVDNNNYFEYVNPRNGDYRQWPFDNPQFLILNLAIGGDLGGPVPASFIADQLEIDYVRVFSKASTSH